MVESQKQHCVTWDKVGLAELPASELHQPFTLLAQGSAHGCYSNRETRVKNWKSASWRAAAKGRRASLCIDDEWAHGKVSQPAEKEVKNWRCWQALNVQLPHIALHHNLHPRILHAHRTWSRFSLCDGNEAASREVASTWCHAVRLHRACTVGVISIASVHFHSCISHHLEYFTRWLCGNYDIFFCSKHSFQAGEMLCPRNFLCISIHWSTENQSSSVLFLFCQSVIIDCPR